MERKYSLKIILMSFGAIFLLIACGGGGGGDSSGATPSAKYSISGTVSGAGGDSVTINLAGSATASTTTDASGNYSFSDVAGGDYTITPSLAGYTFSPASNTITINNANITGRNFTATAQTTGGSWSGTKQLGTSGLDKNYGVAVDTGGNVYVTGVTEGGLDSNTNAGGDDIFLVKYNASGTKQWTRQLGTWYNDAGRGVAVDTGGNVYVTGYTSGGLDGNSSAGDGDMFLVKYNSSGTKQWTRQLGTPGLDKGYGVAVDSSGNVYVTGDTEGGLDGNTNAGSSDVFLVKYNSSGTKQWTRQLGSPGADVGRGIAVDTGGNVYITGDTNGGLDGNTNAGDWDMFLVKYDSAGARQWTRQLGTPYGDYGWSVAVDTGDNVYVTGRTIGDLDGNINVDASHGSGDIYLVKYDSAGTKQWTRQLGASSNSEDEGWSVAVDAGGNVYVAGYTSGGLDGNINAGSNDILLVKYNASGTKQWTRQSGTSGDDYGMGVALDTSGNVYVTGYTNGGLDGNTNAGDWDIFLIKYDANGVKQ